MERRSFLKSVGLAPLATVKPEGDYEQAEENGWRFIFWGWRQRDDALVLPAFWTAHKDGVGCVSVVKRKDVGAPYVVRYFRGACFSLIDSMYAEDAMERSALNFSQDELNRVFAEEKQLALDRLREFVSKPIPEPHY